MQQMANKVNLWGMLSLFLLIAMILLHAARLRRFSIILQWAEVEKKGARLGDVRRTGSLWFFGARRGGFILRFLRTPVFEHTATNGIRFVEPTRMIAYGKQCRNCFAQKSYLSGLAVAFFGFGARKVMIPSTRLSCRRLSCQ